MKIKHLGMTFVKCTRFREVSSARVEAFGIAGDREFVLVNRNMNLLGPDQHGPFLSLIFTLSDDGRRLKLQYPDGRVVEQELRYEPDCESLDYLGMREIALRKVLGDWDQRLSDYSGVPVKLYQCLREGEGIDVKPLTLVTTGSIRALSEKLGHAVDHRRFRANIVIDCDEPHAEDGWDGAILAVGAARLRVRSSVPRCVVTQLNPDTGQGDQKVVRTLATYRDRVRMPDGLMPQYATPGFASYAEVITPGLISTGDPVEVRWAVGD